MADRPRRKYRRYLRGAIEFKQDLGTLASKVVISANISDVLTEEAYLTSIRCAHTLQQFTTGSDVGPVLVGVSHSDYTAAEIEEWIENSGSWKTGDMRSQEIARRKVRRVGIHTNPTGTNLTSVLNDGNQITTKCGWLLASGQTVKFWAYNMGIGALTGNTDMQASGHANLWPR